MFITFEGLDASGKSSAIKEIKTWLEDLGHKVLLTREPGGTEIGEEIRSLLLKNRKEKMDPWTEALLFIGSRRQHLTDVIVPALEKKYIVISDRFMDSTSAYQGAGRKLGVVNIDEIQQIVLGKYTPDLTIYFDVDRKVSLSRMDKRKANKDRLEQEDEEYKIRVEKGYKELVKLHKDRIKVVDANEKLFDVIEEVKKVILESLK